MQQNQHSTQDEQDMYQKLQKIFFDKIAEEYQTKQIPLSTCPETIQHYIFDLHHTFPSLSEYNSDQDLQEAKEQKAKDVSEEKK